MKLKTKRTIAAVGLLGLVGVGLAVHTGTGTPSAWGIGDIAAICPLGAVEAAIASRTIVPPLLIGLVIVAVLVALAGRAFCAWGCPVPLLRRVFGSKERKADKPTPAERDGANDSRNWVLGATVLTTAPVQRGDAVARGVPRHPRGGDRTLAEMVPPLLPPGRPAGPPGAVEPHVPSDGGRRVLPALLGRQLLAVRRRVPRGD